jgi:hypothetical protein
VPRAPCVLWHQDYRSSIRLGVSEGDSIPLAGALQVPTNP